jgi:hypothetical protein
MAVNINVPSQVRTFANLAAFPASGAVKTIYIAEDTNKTYRWDGSTYVEISASAATGLTVGTTPIASGTIGRVLFEGTGNVLQQSSSLFWDGTNNRLGIGTSSPTAPLEISTAGLTTALYINTGVDGGFTSHNNGTLANLRNTQIRLVNGTTFFGANDRSYQLVNIGKSATASDFFIQYWDGSNYNERLRLFSTGNLGINTTTDAGFKLDVNGTARVQDLLDVAGTNGRLIFRSPELSTRLNGVHWTNSTDTLSYGYLALSGATGEMRMFARTSYFPTFYSSNAERMRIATTGNILINTTTDAGFKLDVNGTARVVNQLTVQGMTIGLGGGAVVSNTVIGNVALNSNTSGQNNTAIGESALFSNTTGTANVAVGRRALFASNSAQNVALGNDSLRFNTAANNTAVGYFSLYNNTTGASNTSIGHNSGNTTTTGSGNVFIGKDAVALNATDSNQFVVGSSTTNAGSVTTEINTSTQVWNVVINGVARKILLA